MTERVTIHTGDCRDVLATLPDCSVDAVVTDPPYGLEFMGKAWDRLGDIGKVSHTGPRERDGATVFGRVSYNGSSNVRCRKCNKWKWGHVPGDGGGGGLRCQCEEPDFPSPRPDQSRIMQAWHEAWVREVFRVMKPGAHLLAFGGTRTHHRLMVAIEDAGFEIRDCLMWLYGSGFPKSHRVDRDERFCHCDASAHTNSRTSHEQEPDVRRHTPADAYDDDPQPLGVHHLTCTPLDSQVDCLPDSGLCGEYALPVPVDGLASPQPQGCVPTHTRSVERVDVQDSVSSHSLSPARCNGHPSSLDSALLSTGDSSIHDDTQASITELGSDSIQTDNGISADHKSHMALESSASGTAFPYNCTTCGKPMANGFGSALKPSFEPIILARKPLSESSIAANVLRWGTGALNIDASRIGVGNPVRWGGNGQANHGGRYGGGADYAGTRPIVAAHNRGRFPANTLLSHSLFCVQVGTRRVKGGTQPGTIRSTALGVMNDDGWQPHDTERTGYADADGYETVDAWDCHESCPIRLLDAQSGASKSARSTRKRAGESVGNAVTLNRYHMNTDNVGGYDDSGGASRFFLNLPPEEPLRFIYQPKASRRERNQGLEGLPERVAHDNVRMNGHGGLPQQTPNQHRPQANHHPTVKPVNLMRYLVRLVTPPDGVVLDPFMGSGSTGLACIEEGFRFIGIEQDETYVTIAEARLAAAD